MSDSIIDTEAISSKKSPSKAKPVRVDGPIKPYEYHDQMTPAHVIKKLRDGELSITDLLLLYVIGPYTKHLADGTGRGCYASNEYLGIASNVHGVYAGERLNRMAKKNLLLIFYVDGKRYIETEWGRTADERAKLVGAYGKALRRSYQEMQERAGIAPPQDIPLGASRKTLTPLKENLDPPQGKPLQIEEEENKAKEIQTPASLSANGEGVGFFSNGEVPPSKKDDRATILYKAIIRKRVSSPKPKDTVQWEKDFRKIEQDLIEAGYSPKDAKSEVTETIEAYTPLIGSEFLPEAYSGRTFRQKYQNIRRYLKKRGADENNRKGFDDIPAVPRFKDTGNGTVKAVFDPADWEDAE